MSSSATWKRNLELRLTATGKVAYPNSFLQFFRSPWSNVEGGNLNKVFQATLVTAEVLEKVDLSEVKLRTIISEEDYLSYKDFWITDNVIISVLKWLWLISCFKNCDLLTCVIGNFGSVACCYNDHISDG